MAEEIDALRDPARLAALREADLLGTAPEEEFDELTRIAAALLGAPVALAALSRDAFGQTRLPAVVIGVLNYALVLEELEYEFYQRGTDAPGLIPAADRAVFETLRVSSATGIRWMPSSSGPNTGLRPTSPPPTSSKRSPESRISSASCGERKRRSLAIRSS